MPQKPIYNRPPVLTVPHCFPGNGTVRTADQRIEKLYQRAGAYAADPRLWEGLFRLACLLKNKPAEEPVSAMILDSLRHTETGAFEGSAAEQISRARAAFALFEYNTDRTILKRIAEWLRYFEIEFEQLSAQDRLLYRPADLMELLVKYYRITGMKSVLRLCTKLRSSAFDWTTALHTFQQSIPIRREDGGPDELHLASGPDELEYDEKEKLINHAEMLADGMRYTLYAGLFSGHGQDLSSGKTGWEYLEKHHRALCGGTTADPYLCGCGANQSVSTRALAAWTEAFAAQMTLADSEWAGDEAVRILFNGLADSLSREDAAAAQRVNTIHSKTEPDPDPAALYARLTRAAADAFSHAVTLTEQGFRINWLVPARTLFMVQKTPVILETNEDSAVIRCKKSFTAPVDLFVPRTETASAVMTHCGKETVRTRSGLHPAKGSFLHTEEEWQDGDEFSFRDEGIILREDTHHQGACFISRNRLLCVKASAEQFAFTVFEPPVKQEDSILIRTVQAGAWTLKGQEPADIPVLPNTGEETQRPAMTPYAGTAGRITMFPRTKNACLK